MRIDTFSGDGDNTELKFYMNDKNKLFMCLTDSINPFDAGSSQSIVLPKEDVEEMIVALQKIVKQM